MQTLNATLTEVIARQANLARDIESEHDEVVRLRAVYSVFKKNNFSQLETENRKSVAEQEVQVNKDQRVLNDRHDQLLGKAKIMARLRLDQPSIPVNIDPTGNRNEVEALLRALEEKPQNDEVELLAPRPFHTRWHDNIRHPMAWWIQG